MMSSTRFGGTGLEAAVEIGIGIPNTVRGATGADLLDWGRRADTAGFSSLSSIGAVSYPGYEELTAFAAVAAITERIRFFPNVLIAPARSAAELAKQAATTNEISDGRLTLGLGVGWRAADYELTGRDFDSRGRAFDQQLADLETAWSGDPLSDGTRPVAPAVARPVPIMIGGMTDAAVRRVVDHGVGWTAGGAPLEATKAFMDRVRSAWSDAGREGQPRFAALSYFALGDVEELSRSYLLDYYGPMGDQVAEMIAGTALRTPDAVLGAVEAFAGIGIDELLLNPTVPHPDQVDLLADVVL